MDFSKGNDHVFLQRLQPIQGTDKFLAKISQAVKAKATLHQPMDFSKKRRPTEWNNTRT